MDYSGFVRIGGRYLNGNGMGGRYLMIVEGGFVRIGMGIMGF